MFTWGEGRSGNLGFGVGGEGEGYDGREEGASRRVNTRGRIRRRREGWPGEVDVDAGLRGGEGTAQGEGVGVISDVQCGWVSWFLFFRGFCCDDLLR